MVKNNQKNKFTPVTEKDNSLDVAMESTMDVIRRVEKAVGNYPQIYDYFGVPTVDYIAPLSPFMVGRIANHNRPDSINYSLVGIDVVDDQYLSEIFPQLDEEILARMEISVILKIICRGLINMQVFLGVESKKDKFLNRKLKYFFHIFDNGNKSIYISDIKHSSHLRWEYKWIEGELRKICLKLGLDYESTGLGDYEKCRMEKEDIIDDMWWKTASLTGRIVVTILLSTTAKLSASIDKAYKRYFGYVSTIVSFNNIAAASNDRYCSDSEGWNKRNYDILLKTNQINPRQREV